MNSTLVGMFDTQAAAEAARASLIDAGFASSAVSLTPGAGVTGGSSASVADQSHEGGVIGFFKNIFGEEPSGGDAEAYGEGFRRGHSGVSVSTSSDAEADKAQEILNEAGAIDIDAHAQNWRAEGWQPESSSAPAAVAGAADGSQTLKEVEEELKVGKRAVSRGGVRVYSRTIETPVTESVSLREEHADIQRRAVDRPATAADLAAFKDVSVEVRETGEEAVVSKTARVVGEVDIGTRVTERDEVVHDTLRSTKVEVEQIGGEPALAASTPSTMKPGLGGTAGTTGGSANLDPITGAPGAHPVGTGVGAAAGGMAAGAAAGTVAGPIGTVLGAAAGAVVGGLAGKGVAEKVDPTRDDPRE